MSEPSSKDKDEKELTEEELQEIMAAYKKELAHIYKTAAAKAMLFQKRNDPNLQEELKKCSEEMRADINELKEKYGIHY